MYSVNVQKVAPNSDTLAKLRGRAAYAADLLRPGTALVGIVRCPYAHARVAEVDASGALRIPGVLGVLTPQDFAGHRLGSLIADEPVLTDRARYVGDHVAAVAADNPDSLAAGVAAVRVVYERLPAAFSPDEALTLGLDLHDGAPGNVAMRFEAERGDWDRVVKRVVVWVHGEFEVKPVQHAYMEPRACVARWAPGCITLVVPSHAPSVLREHYARWLASTGQRLEVRTPCIGGSFGAKWEHPTHLVCVEFARRLHRDVGIVLSRSEDMLAGRSRVAMRLRVRLGADSSGRILAKESDILADNGAYSLHGPAVVAAAATRMDNLYRFEAIRSRAALVYTNTPPSECFRGFGNPQAAFAQEQLVDELARRLGLDPIEVRRRNVVREGDVTLHGWRIRSCGLAQCLDAVERALAEDRAGGLRGHGDAERYRTGYGVAAFVHVLSNRGYDPEFEGAAVRLRTDAEGRVTVYSPEVEIGAGTIEVLMRVTAQTLGIPRANLSVALGDTRDAPFGLGSFASRTSFFAGHAAIDAARRLRAAADALAVRLGLPVGVPLREVAAAAAKSGELERLDVVGHYEPTGVEVPDETRFGNISPTYTFGAHAAKVRVDMWTGRVEVMRYWAAHDAGTILNLPGALGQVYGGVVQGLGMALTEAVVYWEDGRLANAGFLDYRIPTFADAVPIEVTFVNTYEDIGPLGAKSIAEPPLIPVPAVIANAVCRATHVRVYQLPLSPETVYRALTGTPGASASRNDGGRDQAPGPRG